MTTQDIEKYSLRVRVLHWVHTGAFIILFLTGLVLFMPSLGALAQNSWMRVLHRAAAIAFIAGPALFLVTSPAKAARGLKQAFTWGVADIGWLRAAPRYYFLGDDKGLPPQGFLNTGQKLWWFITVIFGCAFFFSGAFMWFGVTQAPPPFLQRMIFIHQIGLIVTGAMFILHIYLAVFHPFSKEAWRSMAGGKVSADYAETHHGKWYDEVTRGR